MIGHRFGHQSGQRASSGKKITARLRSGLLRVYFVVSKTHIHSTYGRMDLNSAIHNDLVTRLIYVYIYITYYILHITYYILPIDCLSIALDAHMLSHNGYGPGTRSRAHIHYG